MLSLDTIKYIFESKSNDNMNIEELHHESMKYCELATIELFNKNYVVHHNMLKEALIYEEKAIKKVGDGKDKEPTRGILYLSAASIAWQIFDLDTSMHLISLGLLGEPDARTREELENLQKNVKRDMTFFSYIYEILNEKLNSGDIFHKEYECNITHKEYNIAYNRGFNDAINLIFNYLPFNNKEFKT